MRVNREETSEVIVFTPTETSVIKYLLAGGLSNAEIAEQIRLANGSSCKERTVQSHISSILSKTQHTNRTALALWAANCPEFQ